MRRFHSHKLDDSNIQTKTIMPKRQASNSASRSKQKADAELEDTDDDEAKVESVPDDSEDKSLVNLTPKKKQATPNKLGRRQQINSPLRDAQNSVSVIYVDPQEVTGEVATGVVVIPRGFMMDKWMAEPFYLDRNDKIKIEYLSLLNCVPWVINGAKNKTGDLIKKTISNKEYPLKCICFLTDGLPSESDTMNLVNNCIAPGIWNNYLRDTHSVRKGRGEERNLPRMVGDGRDDTWVVNTWSDAIYVAEEAFHIGEAMTDGSLSEWLRRDRSHLYQLFPEGEVPVEAYKEKYLPVECLRNEDRTRYLALEEA